MIRLWRIYRFFQLTEPFFHYGIICSAGWKISKIYLCHLDRISWYFPSKKSLKVHKYFFPKTFAGLKLYGVMMVTCFLYLDLSIYYSYKLFDITIRNMYDFIIKLLEKNWLWMMLLKCSPPQFLVFYCFWQSLQLY